MARMERSDLKSKGPGYNEENTNISLLASSFWLFVGGDTLAPSEVVLKTDFMAWMSRCVAFRVRDDRQATWLY